MALYKNTSDQSNRLNKIKNAIAAPFTNPELGKLAVNMQSSSPSETNRLASYETDVVQAFSAIGIFDELNEETARLQKEAAVSALLGVAAPSDFYNVSISMQSANPDRQLTARTSGAAGRIVQRSINMQAYQNADYGNYAHYSVDFNAGAVVQSAFSEALFPTKVLTAEQGGLSITTRSAIVERDVFHSVTGEITELKQAYIARAIKDSSILKSNSTAVIPAVAADNSNVSKFVPASKVPVSVHTTDDGVKINTAPLLVGEEFNLFGLASAGGGDLFNHTDMLEGRVVLGDIFVEVNYDDGSGTTYDEVVSINVSKLPGASYLPAQEGGDHAHTLNFRTSAVVFSSDTKQHNGTPSEALALLTTNEISLKLGLTGNLDLKTSNGDSRDYPVRVESFRDANGTEIALTDAAVADLLSKFKFTVIGFKFAEVSRTNANLRTEGLRVDTTGKSRIFVIGAGAPLYHPMPTNEVTDADVVKTLIATAKAVSENNAVTAVLNHIDTLDSFVNNNAGLEASEIFPGAANEIIPYYKSIDLPIKTRLKNISSHETVDDISSLLRQVLTKAWADMYVGSNLSGARMAAGKTSRPKAIIACDPLIAPYMVAYGDPDFLGRDVEHVVVSTDDDRFTGKIVLIPTESNQDGLEPTAFGARGYISELVSEQSVTRDGQTSKEIQVTPRELHVSTLPVATLIEYTELAEALGAV